MENIEELATGLERAVNCMGGQEDIHKLVSRMATMHRTLIQAFTGGFVLNFVRRLAMDYRSGNFDERNKTACRLCELMWSALETDNPYLKELTGKESMALPLI